MKHFELKNYMVEPSGKIAKRVIYTDSKVVAFILNIAKGAALPNHTHFDCTVLVHILQGDGAMVIDGSRTQVKVNDLVEVEGQEKMAIENTGNESLIVYVTLSPMPPSEKYYVDADI